MTWTLWRRLAVLTLGAGVLLGGLIWVLLQLNPVRRFLVAELTPEYVAPAATPSNAAVFDGVDAQRKQLPIRLQKIADGFQSPTDVQFVPGRNDLMVVAQKAGRAEWIRLGTSQRGPLFSVDVPTESELGLLGLSFHPGFADNGKLYVHYNVRDNSKLLTRVSEWQVVRDAEGNPQSATEMRTLLQLEQPYQNHNGGQLVFGPDGYLYIGLGDGGFRDDPHGNAQDKTTWLGKMLRIDINNADGAKPYAIPRDNPFLSDRQALPEIWAYGLRNPWRFSFDTLDRMVIADVGQDLWEEISIAERGDNLGWKVREGRVCFGAPQCTTTGMKDPVYVYGRDDGQSITGGYVYTADDFPELRGKYVFADFLRGRFWAIALPRDARAVVAPTDVLALGRFAILPSTFARDAAGRLYVADFAGGVIYQVVTDTAAAQNTPSPRPRQAT